ncbi:universal stress protein [Dactylosporangium darangshiense]|uniref:UspA domain-containing protein n=1 Tax=Dactylosporangium darangshiense TaxID=579108 RepID=A0ABP8DWG8_9ACTN
MRTHHLQAATMTEQTQAHARRIAAGVDGSPHSKAALRWAIAQAQIVGATVQARL